MKSIIKKKIRKLAKRYPDVHEVFDKKEFFKGKDLSDADIQQMGLPQFRLEQKYMKTTPTVRLINHVNRLQKFYKDFGPDQYQERYNNYLESHVKKMTEQYPEFFTTVETTIPAT